MEVSYPCRKEGCSFRATYRGDMSPDEFTMVTKAADKDVQDHYAKEHLVGNTGNFPEGTPVEIEAIR